MLNYAAHTFAIHLHATLARYIYAHGLHETERTEAAGTRESF